MIQGIGQSSNVAVSVTDSPSGPDPSAGSGVDPCGALLPAPVLLVEGDLAAEIALLSIRAGRDEEHINTVAEETQNAIQDSAEASEVNEMRREASDIMTDALFAGCMQVAQGGLQIAGGAETSGLSGSFAQSVQVQYQGGASLCAAGGSLFTAQGQADQQLDQALTTSYKAIADRAQQLSTEASQGRQDAKSIIANAIQFYQQYEEAKSQMNLTAAGQRA